MRKGLPTALHPGREKGPQDGSREVALAVMCARIQRSYVAIAAPSWQRADTRPRLSATRVMIAHIACQEEFDRNTQIPAKGGIRPAPSMWTKTKAAPETTPNDCPILVQFFTDFFTKENKK